MKIKISASKDKNLVYINDKPITGFISEDVCQICKMNKIYSEEFDAFFCIKCDVWLESRCEDPDCNYCVRRPMKPSSLLEIIK